MAMHIGQAGADGRWSEGLLRGTLLPEHPSHPLPIPLHMLVPHRLPHPAAYPTPNPSAQPASLPHPPTPVPAHATPPTPPSRHAHLATLLASM